jgi:hypothetical protein
MNRLLSTRFYTFTLGLLLFAIGIYGFAFRGLNALPDYLLLFGTIFGFWGLVITIFSKK